MLPIPAPSLVSEVHSLTSVLGRATFGSLSMFQFLFASPSSRWSNPSEAVPLFCDSNCLGKLYKQQWHFCRVAPPTSDWLLPLLFSEFGTGVASATSAMVGLEVFHCKSIEYGQKANLPFLFAQGCDGFRNWRRTRNVLYLYREMVCFLFRSHESWDVRESQRRRTVLFAKNLKDFRVSHSLERKMEKQKLTGTRGHAIN